MAFQRTRGGFLPCRRRRTAAITIRAGQFGRLTTTTRGGGSENACRVSKTRMPAIKVPRSPPRSGWCARMNCLRRRSLSFIQPSPASPPPHDRIAFRRKAVTAAQSRSGPAVTVRGRAGFPDGSTTGLPSGRPEQQASLGGRLSLISILLATRADFVRRRRNPGTRWPYVISGLGVFAGSSRAGDEPAASAIARAIAVDSGTSEGRSPHGTQLFSTECLMRGACRSAGRSDDPVLVDLAVDRRPGHAQ